MPVGTRGGDMPSYRLKAKDMRRYRAFGECPKGVLCDQGPKTPHLMRINLVITSPHSDVFVHTTFLATEEPVA